MPAYFLLLIALTFTARKGENQTKGKAYATKLEAQPEQIVAHYEGHSILRENLMAQLIESKLKLQSTQESLSIDQELSMKDGRANLTEQEIQNYEKASRESARLLVSYSDHLRVYFIPVGLEISHLKGQLDIKEEQDRKLIWMSRTSGKAERGEALYLLSVNKDDLVEFDSVYFEERKTFDTFATDMHFKLNKGQQVKGYLNYKFYVEGESAHQHQIPALVNARKYHNCYFTRNAPNGTMNLSHTNSLQTAGLSIRINNAELPLDLFAPEKSGEQEFELSFSNMVSDSQPAYDVFLKLRPQPIIKDFIARDLFPGCGGDPAPLSSQDQLKTRTEAKLTLTIKGHGETIKTITL